ncbi:type I phosphomannose isomerase catalytic subunit [Robinsoniella sp. KNHs210]|uniref:type I phosphomannose isomerase catalytic subunit n=1 Tax=Robinsoniella sp. KNHs210 TaxID=1469950 RepID=UPI0004897533|nr:type I phosphomannose isomerase catalytic subunit [Robinsoniella sp. KNHs210]
MSVLRLEPVFKEYLWGGTKLVSEYNKQYRGKCLAESWELSCHKNGVNYITNQEQKQRLESFFLENPGGLLGKHFENFQEFPILIKYIDAKQNLSIQVHPNDAYAMEHEQQHGKTEMWYVLDCEEGAYLYYGFAKEVTKEEVRDRIEHNTLLEVLNKVYVQKGDTYFIEAGTVHGIGQGIVVAEIQQNSDVTYRLYDYGRLDAEGRKRPLHIEKALDVLNLKSTEVQRGFRVEHLASCKYFNVDKYIIFDHYQGEVGENSFLSLLIIKGEGILELGESSYTLKKGDSMLLTAESGRYQLEGRMEILCTQI